MKYYAISIYLLRSHIFNFTVNEIKNQNNNKLQATEFHKEIPTINVYNCFILD